jgi:hypothetical protein
MYRSFLGHRLEVFRHADGVVSWSVLVYLSGLRLLLIPRRPWVIRFRRAESGWREFALMLHLGWFGVYVRLGEVRERSIERREVTNG